MLSISKIVAQIDAFVWGPVMLVLLVGTGVLLTVRCNFLTWRNLPWALKKTLSKEARTKSRGTGDVSPFSALTTALAATIGTGNIVGVATAMVSGGAGALVWMWISACFADRFIPRQVEGRTVIVHSSPDTFTSTDTFGSRIACGVIRRMEISKSL